MGLNDRERQILDEIERRFHEEDPDLARAVSTVSRRPPTGWQRRGLLVGMILSAVLTATYFWNLWTGVIGFVLLIGSTFAFLRALESRGGVDASAPERAEEDGPSDSDWSRRHQ